MLRALGTLQQPLLGAGEALASRWKPPPHPVVAPKGWVCTPLAAARRRARTASPRSARPRPPPAVAALSRCPQRPCTS